tara:strand:- start:586 stop:1227 length:642 start_codon:yes stop_codon:yes gene_type:complete
VNIRKLFLTVAIAAVTTGPVLAEVGLGADVVNRYVWRGTDFGNAVSVQPGISYATGAIEVGAWSSWAINGGGANENDLYVSFAAGPVGITITDYFFPANSGVGDNFFEYGDDGAHIIEVMGSFETGPLSLAAAINVIGSDSEDSFWIEAGYGLGEVGGADVSLSAGLGNGAYTTDTDPNLVAVGVNISSGDYFGSYIINPDKETSFMVFGTSF